jgi:diguanylate cyclase (GGDEF)-like protein/PAS domain S-box-containing protein
MNNQTSTIAVEQLRQALGQFQAALNVVDDAIALYSSELKLLWCNIAFEDFTGSQRISILGQDLSKLLFLINFEEKSELSENQISEPRIKRISTNEPIIFNRKHRGIGCTFMLEAHHAKFKADQETLVLVVKNITDKYKALDLQRQADLLEKQAMHCPLTGLLNRRGIYKELEELSSDGMTECLTIIFCDVNKFKDINDTYGHDIGDQILKHVSSVLRQSIRKADFVGRIAGDEFLIGINSTPKNGKQIATKVAERITNAFTHRYQLQGEREHHLIEVSISLGIAQGSDVNSIDELIKNADTAMYLAKSNNHGFHFYNSQLKQESKIESFIRKSSNKHMTDGLIPFSIQPIISIHDNNIIGYEALVRPMSSDGVLIPADKFIMFHEEKGSIHNIDKIIISSILGTLNKSLLEDEKFISINVSALTLCREEFAVFLTNTINKARISFTSVVIEITETGYIQSQSKLLNSVETLSSRGVRFFLDDFGVGQTGLIQLLNLPVQGFKIDSTLFNQSKSSDKACSLLINFAQFAKHNKMTLIVEGIENEADINHLIALNLELAQGYKFCPPVYQEMLLEQQILEMEGLSCPTDIMFENPFR